VGYRWSEKPVFLRTSALLFFPLAIVTLIWGFVDEPRVFYDMYALLVLLIADTVARLVGVPITPASAWPQTPALVRRES
jgi:hypothetical protein